MSKQLREKTLQSYEQGLRMFALWLEEQVGICDAEEIWVLTIRTYILDLQVRGKYTVCIEDETKKINYPHQAMRLLGGLLVFLWKVDECVELVLQRVF